MEVNTLESQIFNFTEMFERSINLKEPWHVARAEFREREKAVHVYVEARKTVKYKCPKCGKECKRYDDEDIEREWRHSDVVLYPCYVHCRRPRIKCEEHGIQVVNAPWARPYDRFTLSFEGYAMLLAENMSLNEARKILRISRTALLHIVQYWVDKAVDAEDMSGVTQLSLDETSFKKGHSYVTVIGEPSKHRVIGVEDGRGFDAVEKFSYDLEKRGGDCNKISDISMDLSRVYRHAVAMCFPQATVVYDHFHVKKIVLEAMDKVRQEEQGRKIYKNKRAGKKLLMIPERRMTDQQKEKQMQLCSEYPNTGRAFRMVQQFDDLYMSQTKSEAKVVMKNLTSWMMHSRLEPMKRVAKSLRRNEEEIMAYFINRSSNAFAEGINSLIQTGKRKARGFRTFNGYRTMIFLAVGKLQLSYPRPFP